jgi:hypothetical protein
LEGGAKGFRTLPGLYPADNETATGRLLDCRFSEPSPCGADHRDVTPGLRAPEGGIGQAEGLNRTSNRERGALDEASKKTLGFLSRNRITDRDLTNATMTLRNQR